MAVQSRVTSGRSRRALWAWMARAMRSLPVPDSPEMHTLASPGATFSTLASTSWSCVDCPTMPCWLVARPPSPSRLSTRSSRGSTSASSDGRSSHTTPGSSPRPSSQPASLSTTTGPSSASPRSRCPSSHAVSGGCRLTSTSAGRPWACTASSSSCSEPTKCVSQPRRLAKRRTGIDSPNWSSRIRTFIHGLCSEKDVRS